MNKIYVLIRVINEIIAGGMVARSKITRECGQTLQSAQGNGRGEVRHKGYTSKTHTVSTVLQLKNKTNNVILYKLRHSNRANTNKIYGYTFVYNNDIKLSEMNKHTKSHQRASVTRILKKKKYKRHLQSIQKPTLTYKQIYKYKKTKSCEDSNVSYIHYP